jgi:4-hydroxybenzoate polyprenyltransferase
MIDPADGVSAKVVASRVPAAGLWPACRRYVAIARPDHWIKNAFMLPGTAAALAVVPYGAHLRIVPVASAVVATCLGASANYTINEYLDAGFDRFHPTKHHRPGAQGLLNPWLVALQYGVLGFTSLLLAAGVSDTFLLATLGLLLMGVLYNVPPIRTKDKAYLDTLSESINSPIRFLLGWFAVAPTFLPPASALLAYWMGGAFLMGVKRYAEYRSIGDPARAALYRRSYAHYTEQSLLLAAFFFAMCSAFFIGIFLIKYRVEFLLTSPLYAALFTWYLAIGRRHNSAAQAPEKLHGEVAFMCFAAVTFIISAALFFIDVPFLQAFMEPHVIRTGLHGF